MLKIAILGPGRAGGALALAFARSGLFVNELIYHEREPDLDLPATRRIGFDSLDSISSDILVFAVPDQHIQATAAKISGIDMLPGVALHVSGSLSSDELGELRQKGVSVGSMHPLVAISDPVAGADRFAGAYFCVEGDSKAVEAAGTLVAALGGKSFSIDARSKSLYHAAAVMASGNVTALFDAAVEMLSECGIEREQAHNILLPLLSSTIANLGQATTSQALTGPFVRGDVDAFERHLAAIEKLGDEGLREIYLTLAERSAEIANPDPSNDMRISISIAKRRTGC